MNDVPTTSAQIAAEWEQARFLYPLYAALAREFVFDVQPCPDLENALDVPDAETVDRAREWLALMDGHMQVHQLRQFLQTTPLANEAAVRALLTRHLRKPIKTEVDRDKIDFLLVQYFSLSAPSRLEDADVDISYVAQLLEPVLGEVDLSNTPVWFPKLEDVLTSAQNCTRLSGLLRGEILERGRAIKAEAKQDYFQPVAMMAFTRFSFLMRRVFFRLLHNDLNAILDGIHGLEQRGVATLDCRRAGFARSEPAARLRMICQSWKVMFHAEYSSGQPLQMLVDLRSAVEDALSRSSAAAAGSITR
jgi:hypothetical protein